MKRSKRKLLSQNFIHSHKLVSLLIAKSSITKNDIIVKIGPGKGFITKQLIKHCKQVIAIEKDKKWYHHLLTKYNHKTNLKLYHQDFLTYKLPQNNQYKIFANPPFSIEALIVRKLLNAKNPPDTSYLVIDQRFSQRLIRNKHENLLSLTYKPWFTFSVIHNFNKKDFFPSPNVDAVMIEIKRKEKNLIPKLNRSKYIKFIKLGFNQGNFIRKNLLSKYQKNKINKTFQMLGISYNKRPSQLDLKKWINLYNYLKIISNN